VIQVADFGLAESTYTKSYFRQDHNAGVKLPIKWMAPESLTDGVFSEKTDWHGKHAATCSHHVCMYSLLVYRLE